MSWLVLEPRPFHAIELNLACLWAEEVRTKKPCSGRAEWSRVPVLANWPLGVI